MPTTVVFLSSPLNNGVEVESAPKAFSCGGKNYAAGSFIVRADQAFRPHVLDMFEPQDHPQDFAYPGGPPVKPYDITGYTLALQTNVALDRAIDGAPPHFPVVPDVNGHAAARPCGRNRPCGLDCQPRHRQQFYAHQPSAQGQAARLLA